MKEIPLTQGKVALVDFEDYVWLVKWKWHFASGYAVRRAYGFFGHKTIWMHREIMQTPDGMETDHINGDKLDNRRKNLRVCTHMQNLNNRGKQKNNTSGYKGVYWHNASRSWMAAVKVNGKQICAGYFKTAEEAARAYDVLAQKINGEFSQLNFPKK